MVVVYYILALTTWLVGAIFLIFFSFKSKYKFSIPARFFLFKNPRPALAKVHFHLCSFGEVVAMKPIMQKFDDKLVTTTTQTGFEIAKKICKNVRYLPFEIFLPFWLRPSKILVIFEAELWLMLVVVAKFYNSKVILVNARISDRSFDRYKKFSFFYHKIFSLIDAVYAQSKQDSLRLASLGAKNIVVSGNIKSAFLPTPSKIYPKPAERVIILASTHNGEEEILLRNLKLNEFDKLIIVPRHPERFENVAQIAQKWAKDRNFSFTKFSQSLNFDAKITLVDMLGELVNIYAISDVVVLGGSFLPNIGGHNPIECAQFSPVLISGKHIFNQKPLFELIENVNFIEAGELDQTLKSVQNRAKITKIGDATPIINDIRSRYEQ